MAEIQTNITNRKQKGISKSKKLLTRVDLTPMVDLGFLLITFFIFTSALAKPKVMKLNMPDDSPNTKPLQSSEDKTITLLVGKDNRLYFYSGVFKGDVKEINYKELRNVIIEKKQQVYKKFGSSKLVILIKVTNEATFKNIVNALDEMIINDVATYMLLEPEAAELEAIKIAK